MALLFSTSTLTNYSEDGINWYPITSPYTLSRTHVIDDMFVSGDTVNGDTIIISPDGKNWTRLAVTGLSTAKASMVFGGNGWYGLVDTTGKVYTSPDLITWTLTANTINTSISYAHYVGGKSLLFYATTNAYELNHGSTSLVTTAITNNPWTNVIPYYFGNKVFLCYKNVTKNNVSIIISIS